MINEKNKFLTVSWLSGLLSAEIFISTGEWGVQMPPLTSAVRAWGGYPGNVSVIFLTDVIQNGWQVRSCGTQSVDISMCFLGRSWWATYQQTSCEWRVTHRSRQTIRPPRHCRLSSLASELWPTCRASVSPLYRYGGQGLATYHQISNISCTK